MPSYELIVYGCQMNTYDGENLAAVMEAAGYTPAAEGDIPDVTLVYTCAVRQSATERAQGRINALARRKQERPDALIGVGGCWPVVAEAEIKAASPHVDFTFGTTALERVPALIAAARDEGTGPLAPNLPPKRGAWPRAGVAIMMGCDNFCSYCVVPYARGRERSRPEEEVLREVDDLVTSGFRDITLLGQNVNSYRDGDVDFARLLAHVDRLGKDYYLRFTTNHPRDFGPDVVAVMAGGRNIAPHLHLPLQSGSDRILAAMNRGYTAAEYTAKIAAAREFIPGLCLTTDLLVGFPGEEEEDFEGTLAMVRDVRFDSAYTFIYSPRPGTAALKLGDPIPRTEKTRRLQTIIAAQRDISISINTALVGHTLDAYVEGRSARDQRECAGRTASNKIINFAGDYEAGARVRVRVTAASSWNLRGEAV